MHSNIRRCWLFLFVFACLPASLASADDLKLLFLGDNGHHRPGDRFAQVADKFAERGLQMKYTDNVENLNAATLNQFDGLVVYANIDDISKEQADALLEYVASGKGFIPLHCATYCFRNDSRIVALMGAQFQKHGGEVFSTEITAPMHPIMTGFDGFESWDETYVHTLHNEENRSVLEVRRKGMQADGNTVEPWTWIRTHGKGRVFYTAWGHDERTWGEPGFQNLLERGIRWACGDAPAEAGIFINRDRFDVPAMTSISEDVKPFEYIDVGAKIPNYVPSNQWGTQGDPLTKMQLPLPAEESIKHYVTPENFHLEIYATEDFDGKPGGPAYAGLGGKPIAMNWDERGRLWVCETIDYPNELKPQNKGRDRIRVCEDTDGDGQADKFTVFAENLSIPTAITFHRGAVIVQNGTETLWLKDTNGDDVADRREIIISNWALGDTHGGVSNIRYGIDNWFWGMQGYNNSEPIITATGEKQPGFRMGFWRFRLDDSEPPAVTELEFIRSTDNNTWGLGISEEGLIFGSTANRNPSVYMPIANKYYEQVRGWGPERLGTIADSWKFAPITERIRQVDQHGGYTAGAGHALYTGRNYPQQWWNRTAFVAGPTGKLVGTFVIKADGADFNSTSPINLVASDDEWAAPIAAEVGPDGNVWVLDWYNYIVQHNPTPRGFETGKGNAYESDLRDKKHGRFYRVLYGDKSAPVENLAEASNVELVKTLQHSSMLVRLHAQRLLIERQAKDAIPALSKLAQTEETDEVGLNVGAMHAITTLSGMGYFTAENKEGLKLLTAAANNPAPGVRRLAIQSLPNSYASTDLIQVRLHVGEEDPQVKLAMLLALADQDESELAGSLAAWQFANDEVMNDRWLADAVTAASAKHFVHFIEHAAQYAAKPLAFTPQRAKTLNIVAEHFSRGKPNSEELQQVLAALSKGIPEVSAAVLDGIGNGWQKSHQVKASKQIEESLVMLLDRVPTAAKGRVIQLGSAVGSEALEKHAGTIIDALFDVIEDEEKSTRERTAAARQLVEFRSNDEDVVSDLIEVVGPQSLPEFAEGVMDALMASTAANLGEELIARSRSMTPNAREAALRVMLARPQTTAAFLDAVDAGQIQLADLSLDQKRSLSEHPSREIRERATKMMKAGGGLPNADRQKVVEQLIPITHQKGDVELGKAMFVKHCSKCHKHGDVGEDIGPNLTGMVVHPKEELLVHIMDPSRSVEGNFRLYTVVTTEGRILSGMMAAETRTSIELIDTEAKRKTIPRADIEELLASPKSLMPEGFEKQMTQDELKNLLEFLTDKGKFIPVDFRKIATIISSKRMFYGQTDFERLIFDNWKPKTFNKVPFLLVDPKGDRLPNAIMLHGPQGTIPPTMPRKVEFPVNSTAAKIHVLGGIGGWSFPAVRAQSTSVIMRVHFADGKSEDHELKNGVHFADYIRRVDVDGSEYAFDLNGRQVRYFAVDVDRKDAVVDRVELIKGDDPTAPIFMAVTVETP